MGLPRRHLGIVHRLASAKPDDRLELRKPLHLRHDLVVLQRLHEVHDAVVIELALEPVP